VALSWARDWTIFDGSSPDAELTAEFESLYTEEQRRDIVAVLTVMSFSNHVINTMTGKYLDNPWEVPNPGEK
jgi:hypothetical protein